MPTALPHKPYHHGDLRLTLIAAAEAELVEKGLEGFSLRGCAKRAGVSHAAPAHHFKDADALLSALAAEGFDRLNESMVKAMDAADGGMIEKFVASGVGYVMFACANPALFHLMFGSKRPDHESPRLSEAGGRAFAVLTGNVLAMTGRDYANDPAAGEDVIAAWAMVHGLSELLIGDKLHLPEDMPPAALETMIAAIIRRSAPKS
ncbi:TetR/AcrR family transcriptional regulator [Mesorhizobium sp. YIM 152430]|uniref:TetR/AcrR family transcriptional regulator n=1 Tax=Mesorhizobium sp. YIM 152430 TaxID=3031761 RepID=UPI0023DAA214|nr:TetR/AcrR family transcriptional regulator [Mesorhizobium sp. YIM 152430]MDF1601703.1 TetR/AcrR family transcriptional regulator [Mesorhizobium sp. YIM 152430]